MDEGKYFIFVSSVTQTNKKVLWAYHCCMQTPYEWGVSLSLSLSLSLRSRSVHGSYLTVITSWTTLNLLMPGRPFSLVEFLVHSKPVNLLTSSTQDMGMSAMQASTVTLNSSTQRVCVCARVCVCVLSPLNYLPLNFLRRWTCHLQFQSQLHECSVLQIPASHLW